MSLKGKYNCRLTAAPVLKTRNDSQNQAKPDVSDEEAMKFFKLGAQPKTSFFEFLKKHTSEAKAKAKIDSLLHSEQIVQQKWEGRGTPKVLGLPKQVVQDNLPTN